MTMIHDARTDVQAKELPPCPEWCEEEPGHRGDPWGSSRSHTRTLGAVTVEQYEDGEQDWPITIGIDNWIAVTEGAERDGTLLPDEADGLAADLSRAVAFVREVTA